MKQLHCAGNLMASYLTNMNMVFFLKKKTLLDVFKKKNLLFNNLFMLPQTIHQLVEKSQN